MSYSMSDIIFLMFVFVAIKKMSLQIPNITEIQPNYGPRTGGTLITVTGPHLDAGKTRKVTLNDVPCPIQRCGSKSPFFFFKNKLPFFV